MLQRPAGPIDMVLDTDAYNEIDDQYAIAYALSYPEKLRMQALCAAPFDTHLVPGPAKGMARSYEEILRLLGLMGKEATAFKGSERFLPDEKRPFLPPLRRIWPAAPWLIPPKSPCTWRPSAQ